METSMTDCSTKEDKQKLRLPKNIRQIGNIQGAVRIYMEDYVYTYLHGSGKSGWAHRGSVFLGSRCQENGQKYIFISGLVHIPDESFQNGIPEFTDLMWGGVYQDMKQFYEDVEILGWAWMWQVLPQSSRGIWNGFTGMLFRDRTSCFFSWIHWKKKKHFISTRRIC